MLRFVSLIVIMQSIVDFVLLCEWESDSFVRGNLQINCDNAKQPNTEAVARGRDVSCCNAVRSNEVRILATCC